MPAGVPVIDGDTIAARPSGLGHDELVRPGSRCQHIGRGDAAVRLGSRPERAKHVPRVVVIDPDALIPDEGAAAVRADGHPFEERAIGYDLRRDGRPALPPGPGIPALDHRTVPRYCAVCEPIDGQKYVVLGVRRCNEDRGLDLLCSLALQDTAQALAK